MATDLKSYIRDIPDFPKPGIIFKDITPLLLSPEAFKEAINQFKEHYQGEKIVSSQKLAGNAEGAKRPTAGDEKLQKIDLVAGIESRGFIFGSALAIALNVGFVPIRKPGKLPYKTRKKEYALEYGTDTIEIHEDAVKPGQTILLIDDLIATGGTAAAAAQLLKELGGNLLGVAFLVELSFLNGAEKLKGETVFSLLKY